MQRTHATVEIARPPEVVFPWLVEPELRLQWVDGLERSERTGDGRYREVFNQAGIRTAVDVQVRRLEPPRVVEIRVTSKHFDADAYTEARSTGAGTRVESTIDAAYKSLMLRAAAPVITRQTQSSLERSLATLKELVESAAT
jgi:carbon monoxide dehydrogenase subunit G